MKTEKELKTKFDKWAYFLKNLESFEDIPQILNEDVFQKAFGTAEVANFTPEQRAEYEQSRMNYLGVKAVSDTAKDDRSIEIAKSMKNDGLLSSFISKHTGIREEDIEKP